MRRLLANSLCHLDPRLRTTLTSLHLPLWRCVRLPCVVPQTNPSPASLDHAWILTGVRVALRCR